MRTTGSEKSMKEKAMTETAANEKGMSLRTGSWMKNAVTKMKQECLKTDEGIDGILVSVGLCVIALLLCVVMKDSLSTFITTLVNELTLQAKSILSGAKVV